MIDIFERNVGRVLIFGGRDLNESHHVEYLIQNWYMIRTQYLMDYDEIEVICGMQTGGDMAGKLFADRVGFFVHEFPAEWKKYGRKRAGAIRNRQMRDEGKPNFGISFTGGPGTFGMRSLLSEKRIPWIELGVHGISLDMTNQ